MSTNELKPAAAINTANFEVNIGEIEIKGISIKNVSMSAHADFSDERVKLEVDGAIAIFKMILNFADQKLNKIIDTQIAEQFAMRDIRIKEAETRMQHEKAEITREEAAVKRTEAETKKIEAETRKILSDLKKTGMKLDD